MAGAVDKRDGEDFPQCFSLEKREGRFSAWQTYLADVEYKWGLLSGTSQRPRSFCGSAPARGSPASPEPARKSMRLLSRSVFSSAILLVGILTYACRPDASPTPERTVSLQPADQRLTSEAEDAPGVRYADEARTPGRARTSALPPTSTNLGSDPFTQSFTRSAETSGPTYPLRVSYNNRFLVDANDTPFVINGDTPWSLVVQLTRDEIRTYLDDRVSLGVNAIMFNLLEHRFGDENPDPWTNQNGEDPFSQRLSGGSLDFTTPNEAYWSEVDWLLQEAASRGIVCLLVPAYVGYQHTNQGWAEDMEDNGPASLEAYGQFLGNRYVDTENIIWVMGGDWGPVSSSYDLTDEIDALATGIKSVDAVHLMTAHADRGTSALDAYDKQWLDFNTTYSTPEGVAQKVRNDYVNRSPVSPTFFIEGRYENEEVTPRQLRAQYYKSILGGAFGHLYGASNVWYFDAPNGEGFADTPSDDWPEALDYPAANDLLHLQSLLIFRNVTDLIPDYGNRLLTSGGGTISDESYAPCSIRPDGRVAACYIPENRTVTVDLDKLSGSAIRIAWYNPVDGSAVTEDEVSPSGEKELQTPGSQDWILLLDDTSLNLPIPNGQLPVRLAGLQAAQQGETIRIAWKTLTETGNRGFGVERRIDREPFSEIAFLRGEGRSDRAVSYSYVDAALPSPPATLRYRLRQVDLDGTVAYSDTVRVDYRRPSGVVLTGPYPEPARETVTVQLSLPTTKDVSIEVFDIQGRLVQTVMSVRPQRGEVTERISVQNMASGTYFVRVRIGSETTTRTLTVLQ